MVRQSARRDGPACGKGGVGGCQRASHRPLLCGEGFLLAPGKGRASGGRSQWHRAGGLSLIRCGAPPAGCPQSALATVRAAGEGHGAEYKQYKQYKDQSKDPCRQQGILVAAGRGPAGQNGAAKRWL